MRKFGIGLDVGGTKIWGVAGTENGEILVEIKEETARGFDSFMDQVHTIISKLTKGIEPTSIRGIGIGLPGTVQMEKVEWVPNLPELNGIPLADVIKEQWKVPVLLKNDGQLALMGEQWKGVARHYKHVVMVILGTGIGGAIMINGQIWEGAQGTAGSMGWLTMDLQDSGDPEQGWWERKVSGTAITLQAMQLSPPLTSHRLFQEASIRPDAEKLVNSFSHCLGVGLSNLASIMDPEVIVIGGGLSQQLSLLLPGIKRAFLQYASPRTREVPVLQAELLDRAGVMGALKLALFED